MISNAQPPSEVTMRRPAGHVPKEDPYMQVEGLTCRQPQQVPVYNSDLKGGERAPDSQLLLLSRTANPVSTLPTFSYHYPSSPAAFTTHLPYTDARL